MITHASLFTRIVFTLLIVCIMLVTLSACNWGGDGSEQPDNYSGVGTEKETMCKHYPKGNPIRPKNCPQDVTPTAIPTPAN